MFALGAVPTNFLWFIMAHHVRAKGLEFPIWNFQMFTALRNYHDMVKAELDPSRKRSFTRLLVAFYISFAWCLVWFVVFIMVDRWQ